MEDLLIKCPTANKEINPEKRPHMIKLFFCYARVPIDKGVYAYNVRSA